LGTELVPIGHLVLLSRTAKTCAWRNCCIG
jgi:hypothetical protein